MRLAELPRPERYRIHLHVDPKKDRYRGEVEIELEIAPETRAIELHAVDLEIGAGVAVDAEGEVKVAKVRPNPERETVTVVLERALVGTRASLLLAYEGPLRADLRGLYLARSGKRRYAATQLEAADARRVFPCFDEPAKKARFALSVSTPAANAAVSNGAIVKTERKGRSKTVHFAETPKLST